MSSGQFELKNPPTDAVSCVAYAPDSPTKLLVASWDRHVYLYDTHAEEGGKLIQKYEHRAPVLGVCFGEDENEAFTAGLDWDVRRIDLRTGEQWVLSSHDAPAAHVVYAPATKTLFSASWDSTLHIHSSASTQPNPHVAATLPLPAKPFALSLSPTRLTVAMSTRVLHVYDTAALSVLAQQSNQEAPNNVEAEPMQRRESALKFMTRALASMPDDRGFAVSSIEGRVAVEWFDESNESQARKYAFKCHRQTQTQRAQETNGTGGAAGAAEEEAVDVVYPVHALAFHPIHGTFASGGGDGVVALWDAIAKRRIRQYQRFPASVASLAWSTDGTKLAVGVCAGFEDGMEEEEGDRGPIKVFIREMAEGEAKGKSSK